MPPSRDSFPPPPDLPTFTVEGERGPAGGEAPPRRPRRKGPDDDILADSVAYGSGADDPALARHVNTGLVRHDVALDESRIDPDAARVVQRLERAGYEAYLVGGCVRDLLLGRRPKDFDVATSARPDEVRNLFRNCRIIGRRFRLAHILFAGGKVVEVATFRRNPEGIPAEDEAADPSEDLLIRNDNVFGEAHEDATRRDFTMNALFYDLQRRQVLDWCGGLEDVERKRIFTIGDPHVRFREDPIRILRAIKFAARLDIGIDPDVCDAMVAWRDELGRAARPRVFEEILRLLRGGAAHRSMWLFWEFGSMAVLLPELAALLDDEGSNEAGVKRFWRRLDAIDVMTRERGAPLDDVVLWTVLLLEPLAEMAQGEPDIAKATYEFLEGLIVRISMPRRIADLVRRIFAVLPRLVSGKLARATRGEALHYAFDVLEVDTRARGRSIEGIRGLRVSVGLPADGGAPVDEEFRRRPSRRPMRRGPR